MTKKSWLTWICQNCQQEVGLNMKRVDMVRLHPHAELLCPECGGKTIILLITAAPDQADSAQMPKCAHCGKRPVSKRPGAKICSWCFLKAMEEFLDLEVTSDLQEALGR